MDVLRYLESIRTPAATAAMSAVTHFGDEAFFLLFALTVFWCISKRGGYYILAVGFLGTILNQFLKLWFRVPRPWVLDPEFTVVESARAGAAGYSFPSGHTQNAVGTMACAAFLTRKKWIRAAAAALMFLVPFSRMYLGCHTPADVGVSFVLALFLAMALYPVIKDTEENAWRMRAVLVFALICAAGYRAFAAFYPFPADTDGDCLREGIANARSLLACGAGLLAAKILDDRYIRFQTEAVWWAQILKVVSGLAVLLLLNVVLEAPLRAVFPEGFADGMRYFLMVLFAGALWPLTFFWFSRIGKKKKRIL